MHRRDQGRGHLHALPARFATRPPRIDAVFARLDLRVGNGLLSLPQRHRTQALVGGEKIHQMRRARTRQPDHDDGPYDLLGVDLGVALEQIVRQEAVRGIANAVVIDGKAAECGSLGILVDFRKPQPQALSKTFGTEVFEAGLFNRSVEHRLDGQLDGAVFAVGQSGLLDVGKDRGAKVFDADLVRGTQEGRISGGVLGAKKIMARKRSR